MNGVLYGKLATFYIPTDNAVYMVLAIDKDFVDNTYGVNAVDWPGGHSFGELDGSDRAQFLGYDAQGDLILDFDMDYIDTKSGTPSGYDSLGVLGGEGGMNTGSSAMIQEWGTSHAYSLNDLGYCAGGNCAILGTNLKVDSPATDQFYTPNPTYPGWIYDVIYEVKINMTAFPDGFGFMEIPYIHASPSKIGENSVYPEPGVCPGEIGDFVWNDLNHDGVQDAGEPGLNNVTVQLYEDTGDGVLNPANDILIGSQTTTAGGKYLFQDLLPSDYFVKVNDATVPSGYVITTYNNPTPIINLGESEIYLEADFGYSEPYAEIDLTKTLNTPEPIFVGQEVSFTLRITNTGNTIINILPLQDLYDPAKLTYLGATPASDDNVDDGVINWSDLTESFNANLSPSQSFEVIVRFRAKESTGTTQAQRLAAAANAPLAEPVVDGLLDDGYSLTRQFTTPPYNAPGLLYEFQGASVCYYTLIVDRGYNDNVYADSDAPYLLLDGWNRTHKFGDLDGSDKAVFDINYNGGSYADVTLDYIENTNGVITSGQTGSENSPAPGTPPVSAAKTSLDWNLHNGWTNLTHSPAYNYNQTPGQYWEWHMIYEFSIPRNRMNGECGDAELVSAHNSPAKYSSGTARIGDRVWHDADLDGLQDASEPGLPGVTVNLYQGSTLVRTTQTAPGSSGYYIFNNLAAGTYRVEVNQSTVPAFYELTNPPMPLYVTVGSGGAYLNADFGYALKGTGSIGDRVFYDLNGDGLPDNDNDPGLNGIEVRLYLGACPAVGQPLRHAITAGNGDYDFNNLSAGPYCVDVDDSTLPAPYDPTTNNEPLTVQLADGQDFNVADFGYRAFCVEGTPNVAEVSEAVDDTGSGVPAMRDVACAPIGPALGAIGDFVWYDADKNGIQNVGEPGLPNIAVNLYRDSNSNNQLNIGVDQLIVSTVTDADGGYMFHRGQPRRLLRRHPRRQQPQRQPQRPPAHPGQPEPDRPQRPHLPCHQRSLQER